MTIRSKTQLNSEGLSHSVEWDPADTIVKLWTAPFKLLGSVISRLGAADKVDEEQHRGRWGDPR